MRPKKELQHNATEKRFIDLAEIYVAKYEDQEQAHVKMMLAKGILVDMESDLVFFHLKNKETDKSRYQQERLNILSRVVDEFASIHALNFQIKMTLNKMYAEIALLKHENEQLKLDIKAHIEAMNEV